MAHQFQLSRERTVTDIDKGRAGEVQKWEYTVGKSMFRVPNQSRNFLITCFRQSYCGKSTKLHGCTFTTNELLLIRQTKIISGTAHIFLDFDEVIHIIVNVLYKYCFFLTNLLTKC